MSVENTFVFSSLIALIIGVMPIQVFSFAYIGIPYLLDNTPIPEEWSICSWVTNTASNVLGHTSIDDKRVSILLPLNPASIKILVLPASIYWQFPLLPLDREQNLIDI